MATLESVRQRMIDGGARTAQTFGVNRLLGQIYMLLYMHAAPRSLDEIADELAISKASVSISCRQLAGLGVLRRVWKKGDRKDYYEAETDLRKILDSSLFEAIGRSVGSAREQIADGLVALDGADGDEVRVLKRRLADAESYCDRVMKLLKNPVVRAVMG